MITGRILETSGRPLVGALVQANAVSYQAGRQVLLAFGGQPPARTNDRGEYRIFGLEPGEYYVRTYWRRNEPEHAERIFTFFPGTIDFLKAQPVAVSAGAETSKIDFVNQPNALHRVMGKVVLPAGTSLARLGATFHIAPRDRPLVTSDSLALSTVDRPTGQFEIQNLVPGSYELTLLARTIPSGGTTEEAILYSRGLTGPAYYGRVFFEVDRADAEGLTIELHRLSHLRGRVVIGGSNASPIELEAFRIYPTGEECTPTSTPFSFSDLDSEGNFEIPILIDNRYSFLIPGLPEDAYIADLRQGERSILDTGLVVANGVAPDPVEIVIDAAGGGKIEGVLQNPARQGIANSTVVLVPDGVRRRNSSLYKTVTTDAGGRFLIRGITPGDYKLFAWEFTPRLAWQNADFIARYESLGTAGNVKDSSSTENVSVTFIPR